MFSAGGPEDRIGVLGAAGARQAAAARRRPVAAHVLLPLQEEPDEGPDGVPAEGLVGALLLHHLPHHVAPFDQRRRHEDLQQLPEVSSTPNEHHRSKPVSVLRGGPDACARRRIRVNAAAAESSHSNLLRSDVPRLVIGSPERGDVPTELTVSGRSLCERRAA